MKKIAFITLIIISSLSAYNQENSIINIGVGHPVFFQKNFDENSGGYHSIGNERLHAFVELPQLIKFRKNPNFSVTPGFGYFQFNEDESSGALGGGSSYALNHHAFSLYAKLNYSFTSNPEKSFQWYAGIFSGFYVYSKTTGNVFWWALQQGGNRSGQYNIDQSGKPFFNIFYNGIYTGCKFKPCKPTWFQPAFEVSFLPGYANISDKYLAYESEDTAMTKSTFMFSIIFGFGKKKATRNNE